MSALLVGRDEPSRPIAPIALLLILGACTDPTTSVRVAKRTSAVATIVASPTPTAVAIGNITGYGVNDAGTIVGPSSGKTSSAYLWDASTGLELLGSGGLSWSISDDGHTVGGKNATDAPVVWTATSPLCPTMIVPASFNRQAAAAAPATSGWRIDCTLLASQNAARQHPVPSMPTIMPLGLMS